MNRPSDKALALAEELIDYAHPHMGRSAATSEMAGMVDACNADLLAAVRQLVQESARFGPAACGAAIQALERVAADYEPSPGPDGQHEFFTAQAPIQAHLFPGGKP